MTTRRKKTADDDIIVYPNGIYYFRRGKKEMSLKTTDFKEAVKRKRTLLAKGGDILTSSTRLKIKDVTPDYILTREQDFKKGDIRAITLLHTKKNIQTIERFFGDVSVVKMDSILWEQTRHKLGGNNIVNVRSVFGHFMKWCVKRGYRSTLPIFEVGRIVRRKRRILEPFEVAAIWAHSAGSLRLFISMALLLGMRRSEIMTLEWDQVLFDKRALFLPEEKTKTKRARWVTAPDVVLQLLSDRKAGFLASDKYKKTKWVFPHVDDGRRPADRSGLKTAWHTCLKRAFNVRKGEPLPNITWHDLRATSESYAHKRTDISSTQLEKYYGASVDIQRKIYVQGDVEYVRGVENTLLLSTLANVVGKPRGEGVDEI
jgi:integrase